MALANPLALWLLVLVPIPLLLSRRQVSRRVDVANLYLWTSVADPDASPRLRSTRRQWIVIVQMAIIAALAFAIAQPSLPLRGERVAFVFDLSASMLARDGRGTRFDSARERALATLARLTRRSHVRVIGAGTAARDLGEYSASDGALGDVLAHLRPAAGTADIAGALLAATASTHVDRVVVFSDHSMEAEALGRRVPVEWNTVGTPADNLAITTLVARRRPLAPSDADVVVGVRNYGTRRAHADVEILRDGTPVERRSIDVDTDREGTFALTIAGVGQVVTARLAADDGLGVDNERNEVVPPVERIRVAEEGRTNFFVDRALAADRGLAVERSPAAATDVLVCGCDRLPAAGNVLRVPQSSSGVEVGVLTDDDVTVSAGIHRAYVASERDDRRVVELRFVPESENGISTSFPILVANAMRWLDGRSDNPTQLVAGEPLRWRIGDVRQLVVTGPDRQPRSAQRAGGTMTVVDTAATGVYTVRTPTSERLFAVNAAVDGESDLRTATNARPTAAPGSTAVSSSDFALMRILLLLAAVLVAVEWLVQRKGIVGRAAVALCALVGASGFGVLPHAGSVDVVAALDRSRSIPVRAQLKAVERLATNVNTLRRGDRLGVVDFGADALVRSDLTETTQPQAAASAVADGDTDIAAGLRLARAMLPAQGQRRIVLFSDGRQTVGDAEREAAFLAADGIHTDVAVLSGANTASTPAVARVTAPASARSNEPFDVTVDVTGPAGSTSELTLLADDRPLDSRQLRLASSGSSTVTFMDKQAPGVHVYRAILNTDDGEDSGGVVVSVVGAPNVLYVARAPGVVEPALAGAGFDITRVAPDALPHGAEALRRHDAIVLDDVTADELGDEHASDISRYVEQFGGGLLLLGSSRSLDIAGYPTGPLASSLPIDLRRRSGQQSPSFGLVIVFDKSGSMADQAGGVSKIELARQAVMRVLDVLPPADSLGVIAFDSKPVIVSRLSSAPRGQQIATELQTILPGGATRIASAASLAVQWLNDASTRPSLAKRRVLLISDGETTADDERDLRAAVRSSGVEVSTVAVGANSNRALLEQLAASTGGRSYFPSDLSELPKIVAREAVRSRGGHTVEELFVPRGLSHPILAGLDGGSFPNLSGYVVAAAKPTAISVLTSHLDDPVLCAWQFGLGRVAVFTADVRGAWSASLRAWPNFGRLWVQSARWVSRGLDDRDLRLAFRRDGKTLVAAVDGDHEDGRPMELIDARATVRLPDGKSIDVAFEPSAPGRYNARIEAIAGGPYVLAFTGREPGGAEHHVTGGVFRNADEEKTAPGADDGLLARLAAITGGRVLAPSDNPFAFPRPITYRDITTWIVAVALGLYLASLLGGRLRFARRVGDTVRLLGGRFTSSAA